MENHDIVQFEHHYNPIFHTQIFKIKLAQKFNLQIYTTIYSNYHLFETNIKAPISHSTSKNIFRV